MDPVGIDAVRSRIDALSAQTDASGASRSLGSTAEFDAFGDAYQAALARRDGVAPVPPGGGSTPAPAAGSPSPSHSTDRPAGTFGSPNGLTGAFGTTVPARGSTSMTGFPTTSRLEPGRVIATPAGTRYPTGPTGSAYGSGGSTVLVGTMSSGIPGLPGVDDAKLMAAIEGRAAGPGARPVGGYGKLEPPAVLKAIGNGRLPPSTLTPLSQQSNHELFAPAAAAWDNLVASAAADGIEIRITDSYRDYDEQVDLVRRKGLYSEGGLGARPGTSNHGWGLAVDADVTDRATYEWLSTNGPRFGWVESVPREPWHWEFRPGQV